MGGKKDKGAEKAKEKQREKVAIDKTFGLKNKNKSKAVQSFVKQMQANAKVDHTKSGKPPSEFDKKKKEGENQAQQALLASLFNLATDKKGRVFDPTAKKKAKEKTMEDQKSGKTLGPEISEKLVIAIKLAIRTTNPKGTNMSQIGGSAYLKSVIEEHPKHLTNVSVAAFCKYKKDIFYIAEEDQESQNPNVQCQEDVEAAASIDGRDVYLQLEERRQEYVGDTSKPRVHDKCLKLWWVRSGELECMRDPATGLITDKVQQTKKAKKMTGEEMWKKGVAKGAVAEEVAEEVEEVEVETDKEKTPEKTNEASSSAVPAKDAFSDMDMLNKALDGLPDDLDELESEPSSSSKVV